MLSAAAVTAQFVSGKAARDALFLSSLDFTALPAMLVATSVCSLLLVAANARGTRRIPLASLVPACFVASGVLFLCEWLLRSRAPSITAVVVYLHISERGAAAGFGILADRERALRPSNGEETVRPDCRSGNTGRPRQRTACGADCGRVRRPCHASVPGPAEFSRGMAGAPGGPGIVVGRHSGVERREPARFDSGAFRPPRHRRGPLSTAISRPWSCSARPVPRWSIICSRRRSSRHLAAAISCCGSSPSTTPRPAS